MEIWTSTVLILSFVFQFVTSEPLRHQSGDNWERKSAANQDLDHGTLSWYSLSQIISPNTKLRPLNAERAVFLTPTLTVQRSKAKEISAPHFKHTEIFRPFLFFRKGRGRNLNHIIIKRSIDPSVEPPTNDLDDNDQPTNFQNNNNQNPTNVEHSNETPTGLVNNDQNPVINSQNQPPTSSPSNDDQTTALHRDNENMASVGEGPSNSQTADIQPINFQRANSQVSDIQAIDQPVAVENVEVNEESHLTDSINHSEDDTNLPEGSQLSGTTSESSIPVQRNHRPDRISEGGNNVDAVTSTGVRPGNDGISELTGEREIVPIQDGVHNSDIVISNAVAATVPVDTDNSNVQGEDRTNSDINISPEEGMNSNSRPQFIERNVPRHNRNNPSVVNVDDNVSVTQEAVVNSSIPESNEHNNIPLINRPEDNRPKSHAEVIPSMAPDTNESLTIISSRSISTGASISLLSSSNPAWNTASISSISTASLQLPSMSSSTNLESQPSRVHSIAATEANHINPSSTFSTFASSASAFAGTNDFTTISSDHYTPSTTVEETKDETMTMSSLQTGHTQSEVTTDSTSRLPTTTVETTTKVTETVTSGKPPSFVELELSMSWSDFCSQELSIRGELVQILHREGGHEEVTVDQIQVMNKRENQCTSLSLQGEMIQVQLYLVNKTHHYDRDLTLVCGRLLASKFQSSGSSLIQEKLIAVYLRGESSQTLDINSSREPMTEGETDSSMLDDPGVTIALVIAAVGGCCCVGLIMLQAIVRKRQRNILRIANNSDRMNNANIMNNNNRSYSITSTDSLQLYSPSKSSGGLINLGLNLLEPPDPTRPLNLTQLSEFCADEHNIYYEYQKLPNRLPRLSVVPKGEEEKNRYANILPLAHTRVKLNKEDRRSSQSSYINANYVTGPNNECQYYIATQAPTTKTIQDFWTMVWQQEAKAIVMLTQVEEDGQTRSAVYWPELTGKSAAQRHGDFMIELKQKDVNQEYISSKLEINNLRKIETRQIQHYLFTCWPSRGMPEPISLVKFVLDTRPRFENTGKPLIVHCSPGTGRTGTFIGLDLCMRQFEGQRVVDVMKTVYDMRLERAGAIQNKEQYALLYNAVNEYASIVASPVVSVSSSASTLHALLPD